MMQWKPKAVQTVTVNDKLQGVLLPVQNEAGEVIIITLTPDEARQLGQQLIDKSRGDAQTRLVAE